MSTGVIKSLKCNCTRERGYFWHRRGKVQEEGSRFGRRLKKTILKLKEGERRSLVLAVDKAHHLLFIWHRYLVGILWEENETNNTGAGISIKNYIFLLLRSPSRTFVHACEFFSQLFSTPDVESLSGRKELEAVQDLFGHLPCSWQRAQREYAREG